MVIEGLNTRLEEARKAYYAGEPIMYDAEYDALEAMLAGLAKAKPAEANKASVLTSVGSDLSLFAVLAESGTQAESRFQDSISANLHHSSHGRSAHLLPMLSIENYYRIDDICAWAETLGWPTLSVESKLDGVSDSLVYEGGQLVQALTRGDGASGESVLPQILAAGAAPASIPNYTPFGGRVEIRGEIIIPESKLRALNAELEAAGAKTYATSRNLAAGSLKLLNLEDVKRRGLEFHPWDVLLPDGVMPDSGVERLKLIEDFGFAPSDDRIVTNREELIAAIENMLPTLQEPGAEIGKDGIVVKVDSHTLREKLGRGQKFTRYQVCFKPQNQKAETVIESVSWQVGRQGRITPVANVKPVVLGGVQVARATLNNFTWLTTLGVRIGSSVALVRSGDVIPKIVEILDNPPSSTLIEAPTNCPDCGSILTAHTDEDSTVQMHWCESDHCSGRIRDYLIYIADRTVLEIEGLGPELAILLNKNGVVTSLSTALSDLFSFQAGFKKGIASQGSEYATKALEGNGYPVALTLRMIESLEKVKTSPWPVWIAAMAIPMIGRRLGKVLATQLKLQPEDFPNLPAKLAAIKIGQIDGLGVSKLGELYRYATNSGWDILCHQLHALGVRPAATASTSTGGAQPLQGVAFVITGEFEEFGTREEVTAKLESLGAVSKSSVSKNVTHLIVGAAPGKSKLTKAEQLGISQVGPDWLKQALV